MLNVFLQYFVKYLVCFWLTTAMFWPIFALASDGFLGVLLLQSFRCLAVVTITNEHFFLHFYCINLTACSPCKLQNLLCNEQAAADITESVHCHVGDWSKAALTSLQRRRIDKITIVSLDVILLDHAHFSSSVTQVILSHIAIIFIKSRLLFLFVW